MNLSLVILFFQDPESNNQDENHLTDDNANFHYKEKQEENYISFILQIDEGGKVECPNCHQMQQRIKSHLTSTNNKVKCQKQNKVNIHEFLKSLEKFKKKIRNNKYKQVHTEEIKQNDKIYREEQKENKTKQKKIIEKATKKK